jgi:glycosyltransferase involved in cell wall biosynthesis
MSGTSLDLSLVLPCYNEERVLEESVAEIVEVLDDTRYSYEIIFVDDCSEDRTRELIDRVRTLLDLADEIIMKEDVTLAERVTILTHVNVGFQDHPLQKHFPSYSEKVILRRGCFMGTNATILPGVTAGECAFVAADAVVREDVPAYHVVGGVPTSTIRVL